VLSYQLPLPQNPSPRHRARDPPGGPPGGPPPGTPPTRTRQGTAPLNPFGHLGSTLGPLRLTRWRPQRHTKDKKTAPRPHHGPKTILGAKTNPPGPSKCGENLMHIDVSVRGHYRNFGPKSEARDSPKRPLLGHFCVFGPTLGAPCGYKSPTAQTRGELKSHQGVQSQQTLQKSQQTLPESRQTLHKSQQTLHRAHQALQKTNEFG